MELDRFGRAELAVLGREWLLHGHLQDRVGMPMVLTGRERADMEEVAIDEWMGASPIYTRRAQQALGFSGTDVATIFKGIQLDIGAPHHFLDFRMTAHDENHGEFFLAHCGALMDVEPMGEEFVHGMCHTIEDPTFDATAVATNPRAQVRPIHRPPRVPTDRHPHCAWSVTIDPSFDPVEAHPNVALLESSRIATVAVESSDPAVDDPGGLADYSGPFATDFELEDLSHRALVAALQEVAVQSHLLLRSFLTTVTQRFGEEAALAMVPTIFTGLAGLTAQRLRDAMHIHGDDAEAIAELLRLHPVFWPRTYVDLTVEVVDNTTVRFAIGACPALDEGDGFTWFAQLGGDADRALDAIVWAINPQARCRPAAPRPGEALAYEAVIDPSVEPSREAQEIALAKISSGAAFVFRTPPLRDPQPS